MASQNRQIMASQNQTKSTPALPSALKQTGSLVLQQDGSGARRMPDELHGFRLGDEVTTRGGPDKNGPWRNMGNGTVAGPGEKGHGHLSIRFFDEREIFFFDIKARNLRKVGSSKDVNVMENRDGVQLRPYVMENRTQTESEGKRVNAQVMLTQTGEVYGNPFINSKGFFKFKGVGPPQPKTGRFRDEAMYHGVMIGGFVEARIPPWRDLGVGLVQSIGDVEGSVRVKFNIMGDLWTLNCRDLRNVPDPGQAMFQGTARPMDAQYPCILAPPKKETRSYMDRSKNRRNALM